MAFRFSPRPRRAHLINWRGWHTAVAQAAADDRLMLLCLTAPWCRWCQALDETTLSNDEVITTVNRDFIPVRVDVDERPDIAARYSMGGWPTVAFLTPDGEMLTGATYLPPSELSQVADNILSIWADQREDIAAEAAEVRFHAAALVQAMRDNPRSEAISDDMIAELVDTALSAYDHENGGFGRGAKFPRTDILRALLLVSSRPEGAPVNPSRARAVLEGTLTAMLKGGLYDRKAGGFHRYSAARDWTSPHREKLLSVNAEIIQVLSDASALLSTPEWLAAAGGTVAFIDSELWAVQDGLYRCCIPAADEKAENPSPLPAVYTRANAEAAAALVAFHRASGHMEPLDRAQNVVNRLWQRRSPRGLLAHDLTGPDCFLGDQVSCLEALLALHSAGAPAAEPVGPGEDGAWLGRARSLWESIERYFAVSGKSVLLADIAAPADVPPEAMTIYQGRVGRLGRTETPLSENARLAVALADLAANGGSRQDAARARLMVEQLAPQAREMGNFAIEVAYAAMRLEAGSAQT